MGQSPDRVSRRRWVSAAAVVLLAGVAALAGPHLRAYYHWRAARADLRQFRAAAARAHLRACLRAWPDSSDVYLLTSRACRIDDDLEEAQRCLRECQKRRREGDDEVAFEWALLHAAGGDLENVTEYLELRARKNPADAPLVWEALARGYARVYRVLDSLTCLDRWLKQEPDCLAARSLRGKVWRKAGAYKNALPDLSWAVERDPDNDDLRWDLALCQIDQGDFESAAAHLERLRGRRSGDREVLVRLARCHQVVGRVGQARQLLDAVLADEPDNGLALRTYGQLELAAGDNAAAEKRFRRAVASAPRDYYAHWGLYRSLERQGKAPEAEQELARARRLEDQIERLGEMTTRQMSERPRDPALHCDLGKLLLDMGQPEAGRYWLDSALRLDPSYRPAHAALADYYQARGDAEQADWHRGQAR